MLLPEKLSVFKNVFVGSTWESALTPIAVIPLAEKSTLSALCFVQKTKRYFQNNTVGYENTLEIQSHSEINLKQTILGTYVSDFPICLIHILRTKDWNHDVEDLAGLRHRVHHPLNPVIERIEDRLLTSVKQPPILSVNVSFESTNNINAPADSCIFWVERERL